MSLSPVVKGVLDNVLGGGSLVARDSDPMVGFMDEIPRWDNPWTGKFEPAPGHRPDIPAPAPGWGHHPMPPKPAPGWGHHPGSFETMEIKPGWKPSPPQTLPWDGTPSPLQPL